MVEARESTRLVWLVLSCCRGRGRDFMPSAPRTVVCLEWKADEMSRDAKYVGESR